MKTETTDTNPEKNSEAITAPHKGSLKEPRFAKIKTFLRRRGIWVVAVIIVAGALATGSALVFGKVKVVYTTAAVERGNLENTVVAAGIVQPFKYVDVGAQTSGKLKSLKVKRGDQVEEGQLLAEIDPVLAQTALTSASAALENMASQHSIKGAQLKLALLQRDRNDELFENKVIAASEHDITQAGYDVAIADAAALSAQMRQATASVNTAKANLGYTKITAPMAGEVVSINMLEGQTLNANQSAPNILRIADLKTVTVWAQVSEADIDRVKTGQDVYFTVLGQNRRWTGTILQILPTPELINNVVFYDVLFNIPNPKRELYIQMTAQVFIVLARVENVLLIPTSSIGKAVENSVIKVRVLKPDGRIELRSVKIGIKGEISTEAVSGLKEKELVVIGEIKAKGAAKSTLNTGKGL
ncbi:MAG: efflux RND transporter periplasmic adaptor subunit [Bacteroidota bacterium]